MAVNKVIYGGNTLIDLSADTLTTASQLLQGVVAHTRSGAKITGTMKAGADLSVKAYSSLPSSGGTNEIAVLTSTTMTGWVIQADQPSGTSGLVWVDIGEGSAAPIQLDNLQIAPVQAHQYINGGWTPLEGYVYKGSSWVQFCLAELRLYYDGEENPITGGWNTSNGTKYDTYIDTRITGTGEGRVYPTNMIDVTRYKTLFAEIENASSSLSGTMKLALRSSTASKASSACSTSETIAKSTTKTISVDISGISGSYYTIAASETVSVRWYLRKMWLE